MESAAGRPDELIAMDITSENTSDVSAAVCEADSTLDDSKSDIHSEPLNVGVQGKVEVES